MDKQTQKNLLEIVKKNYEESAEDFSETRKRHLGPLWSELVKIGEKVKDNNSVLDVGCGNGRLLEVLKNHCPGGTSKNIKYLGVDASENLIKIAKKRWPNYNFKKCEASDLGCIPEINFNFVFFIAVMHHLPGKALRIAVLKQLKNKVALDGKIIISTWNLWPQKKYRKLIIKFALLKIIRKSKMDWGDIVFTGFNQKSKRYYHAFTRFGLRRIIKKAGLKVARLYKDEYNYYAILKK